MSNDNKSPLPVTVNAAAEPTVAQVPALQQVKFADPHLLSFIYAHGFVSCILGLVFAILSRESPMIMVIITSGITVILTSVLFIAELKKKTQPILLAHYSKEDYPLFFQNRVIIAEFGLAILWFVAAQVSIPRAWYGYQRESNLSAIFGFLTSYIFFMNALAGIRLRMKELEAKLRVAEIGNQQIHL